ncbi:hypothetical protein GGI20_003097 [Coemansia sp. BCRC 34301]|nr:hypothetical protein GGI20_003097 [Coemansia sp. BCRC 34301]
MRLSLTLAATACLLAFTDGYKIAIINNKGKKETYSTSDFNCHRVSSKFNSRPNRAATFDVGAEYFADPYCYDRVYRDEIPDGNFMPINEPIMAYKLIRR